MYIYIIYRYPYYMYIYVIDTIYIYICKYVNKKKFVSFLRVMAKNIEQRWI